LATLESPPQASPKENQTAKEARRARITSLERNRVLRALFLLLTLGRLKKWERKTARLPQLDEEVLALQTRLREQEASYLARLSVQQEELRHLEDVRARADALAMEEARHTATMRGLSGFIQHLEESVFRTDGLTEAGQKTVQAIEAGVSGGHAWQTLTVLSAERHGTPGFRSIAPYVAPQRKMPAGIKENLQSARQQLNVIDIGSEVLAWENDVYAPLAQAFPCDVVGFDPFTEDEALLQRPDGRFVKTLPYLIGDGAEKTFYSNRSSATSSTLARGTVTEPIPLLHMSLETQNTRQMPSYRLDDLRGSSIPETDIDLLKIDVQGAACEVLENGRATLENTLVVHVEVEFTQIYDQQKLFADVDHILRDAGFAMIDFLDIGRMNYGALIRDPERFFMYGRALWADVVYLAGYDGGRRLTPEQLLSQAVVMHEMYNKQDIVAELLGRHDKETGKVLLSLYNDKA